MKTYCKQGSTILIDAVKRFDIFSIEFLLEHNCQLDLKAR